jgi:flagellar hook-associated protein 1 FlgK
MSWAFQGISTLSSALDAFQTQLDVTGQNIANVNTAGYSEEQANVVQNASSEVGPNVQLGNGVTVESVTRIQAGYLEASNYASTANLGMANAQANTATSVNGVVLDPSTSGLSNDLDSFFNAWSGLAADPSNSAGQLAVQQAGQTLASDIQGTASGFTQLQSGIQQQITSTLQSAQSDMNQIAGLNKQILSSQASGGSPNALMDQRDQAVSNLSSLMNINVQSYPNGSVVVSSGNLTLVNQTGARTLPTNYDAATSSLSDGSNSYNISSGQLAGLFDSANKISGYQSSLDTLATTVSTQVNAVYSTATDSSGNTGESFFTGTNASNFALSSNVSNASSPVLTGTTGNAADGSVAQSIANLSTQTVSSLGNQTIGGYYSQLVGQIGADGQQANNSQSTNQAINQQVQSQISSITGVNLDDEMSNLLRFQRSYQAAAQALNAMDQTTATFLSTLQSA